MYADKSCIKFSMGDVSFIPGLDSLGNMWDLLLYRST